MADLKKMSLNEILFWSFLFVFSLFYLFTGLSIDSIWYDESYTAILVRHSFTDIWRITGMDSHPPLYYILLKCFTGIFGNSALTLRAFSGIGILGMLFLAILPVRRLFNPKTAVFFALITLFAPMSLNMAREARMYTWAAFLVTGSVLYLYSALAINRTKYWVLTGIFSIAAMYTHYYALMAIFWLFTVTGIILLIRKKFDAFFKTAGLGLGIFFLYLPWIASLLHQAVRVSGKYWIPPVTFDVILGTLLLPFSLLQASHLPTVFPAAIIIFLLLIPALIWGFFDKTEGRADLAISTAILIYLLTLLSGIIASQAIRPVLVSRYIVPVMGLLFLAAAYALSRIKPAFISIGILAIILLCFYPQIKLIRSERFNGPQIEAASYFGNTIKPGEVILHGDELTFGVFCYYFPQAKHYLYVSSYYPGFSNFENFKPNGLIISNIQDFLTEVSNSGKTNIWIAQFPFSKWDQITRYCIQQKILTPVPGVEKFFNSPQSFYLRYSWFRFNIMKTSIGNIYGSSESAEDFSFPDIRIRISGICQTNGTLTAALYQNGPFTEKNKVMIREASVKSGSIEMSFQGLRPGKYAILAYHHLFGDVSAGKAKDGHINTGKYNIEPEFRNASFILSNCGTNISLVMQYR